MVTKENELKFFQELKQLISKHMEAGLSFIEIMGMLNVVKFYNMYEETIKFHHKLIKELATEKGSTADLKKTVETHKA